MHALLEALLDGRPPAWMVAGQDRVAHMDRVAILMDAWAAALSLSGDERRRWRAAGLAHDLLRDEDPDDLRSHLPPSLAGLPGPILHGPAVAERLRVEGVEDGELLTAVAHHTVGDARFGRLGCALYAADFLEPGRAFMPDWRAERRARMPADFNAVVREIAGARIRHLIERNSTILPRTLEFWNSITSGAA
ncbi:MAG: HD domain-containing protein [Longimicrobiales bacterium]